MAGTFLRRLRPSSPVPVAASPLAGRTVLAVSPHADDAALSLGATLAELAAGGAAVHVFTVFLGAPEGELSERAKKVHAKMGLAPDGSAVAARRAEDIASAQALGAVAHHGDFREAVYRRRADGSWLVRSGSDLMRNTAPAEPALEEQLAARVGELAAELQADVIATCAAVGGHVDHRRVRAAVERLDVPLVLWEDLPYAAGARPARLRQPRLAVAPGAPAWAGKLEAVAAFASQLPMLMGEDDWRDALLAHARARGGGVPVEILWSRYPRPE